MKLRKPLKRIRTQSEPNDDKRFDYKCQVVSDDRVVWAVYPDGRWRDGSDGFQDTDAIINYRESPKDGRLHIYTNYNFAYRKLI